MSCVLILLMAIGVVVPDVVPVGSLYLSFYIQGGRGYREGHQFSYNIIPIMTLSLLAYFTYIFIYIIFYALGSMSWPLGLF
jgi:hypothetical protein